MSLLHGIAARSSSTLGRDQVADVVLCSLAVDLVNIALYLFRK